MRVLRFIRRNWRALAFGFAGFLIVLAIWMNREAISDIEDLNCSLANLVRVSTEGDSFGSGLDRDDLTPQELAVVTAIARVQELTQEAGSDQIETFRREQAKLEANCGRLTPHD